MIQELIDILENYGIEDARQENLLKEIKQLINYKLSLIDECSLNGECSIIVRSGGEKHSFIAGWKRYEHFVKSYLC